MFGVKLMVFCVLLFVIMFTLPQWFRQHGRKATISADMLDRNFWITMICLVIELILTFDMLNI